MEWEYLEDEDRWHFKIYDVGSFFNVFCSSRCEIKYSGQDLPLELQKMFYPEMFEI